MYFSPLVAKQFRDVFFGENWTAVNFKAVITDVTYEQAVKRVYTFHTIAELVYHIAYYISAVLKVLQGHQLDASDKFSFDLPPVLSTDDWNDLISTTLRQAEVFSTFIEQLPDQTLQEVFSDPKYGTYFRNLAGITEHTHYHLGQIVLIKKILATA